MMMRSLIWSTVVAGLVLGLSLPLDAQERSEREGGDEHGDLPLEAGRTVPIDLDEGSWISVDVSPDGRTLVFDYLGDLFTLPIDGGDATQLTSGMAFDAQPRFSPDGTEVVFTSDRDGGQNIWRLSLDGSDTTRVSSGEANRAEAPDWSPDGRYILFSRAANPISAVNRTSDPSSLDGAVFTSVVLFDVAQGTLRTVEDGATRGRFSPDGRFIAYEYRNRVFAKPISLDGGVWDISDGPGLDPHWSPDGAYAYFMNQASLMRVKVAPDGGRIKFGNPETVKVLERQRVSYVVAGDERVIYTGLPTAEADAESGQESEQAAQGPRVNVVVNWFEHVKQLSPNP